MKWKTKDDREIKISVSKYLIDWDRAVSGPQLKVKKVLFNHWKNHVVCEELYVNFGRGAKYRYDLVNITRKIIVEVSPDSTHLDFNKFMHGTSCAYRKRISGDIQKWELAELNGFKFIELNDEHLNNLTKKMFKETFDLDL